jgi:hypothetical protein
MPRKLWLFLPTSECDKGVDDISSITPGTLINQIRQYRAARPMMAAKMAWRKPLVDPSSLQN